MHIPDLIRQLRSARIQIRLVDDQLALSPVGAIPPALLDAVKTHKPALIEFLRASQANVPVAAIEPIVPQAHYALSSAQRRMWVLSQYPGIGAAYSIFGVYDLSGALSVAAFGQALGHVIDRHESLRTTFLTVDGEPRQRVHDQIATPLQFRNVPDYATALAEAQTAVEHLFDLERGPLLQATLLQIRPDWHLFVLTIHHIVADGLSLDVLMRELSHHYNALTTNVPARPLPPLPVQYKDFAHWQLATLNVPDQATHRAFWLAEFADGVPTLDLPTDFAKTSQRTFRGASLTVPIAPATVAVFRRLCADHEASLFMGLLAALNVLLYRYTGQTDVVVGTPVAGRDHPDTLDQIGFYINTLALRTRLTPGDSFGTLLNQVRRHTLAAFAHQSYPFDLLVDALAGTQAGSPPTLFNVMLMYQRFTDDHQTGLNGIVTTDCFLDNQSSKFDLTISVFESSKGVDLLINYSTDLFTEPRIRRMVDHLQTLLQRVAEQPTRPIGQLDYLTEPERHQLLFGVNPAAATYPTDQTLVTLVEAQANAHPNRVAVVFGDTQLTYRCLNERANQLAHYLRQQHGIGPETHVGLLMERSEHLLVALLGILKAGAAYVPIDPDYPADRIAFTVQDAATSLVLLQTTSPTALAACEAIQGPVLTLAGWEQAVADYPRQNPGPVAGPANLAYIIYTSGSTGQPKGVPIEHRQVVRLFRTDRPLFDFTPHDVWLLFHSICFDFSVWEVFGAWLFGGKLVVIPRQALRDPACLTDLLVSEGVTVLNQVPTMFGVLTQEILGRTTPPPLRLRYVIFGGEALNPRTLAGWQAQYPQVSLINMYGITETTVHVTHKVIGPADIAQGVRNIGSPIPTLSVYLMDAYHQLVPVGVVGEIRVGGAGIGRGYLNRLALTAERFIDNPYVPGERLYCSGDLGRWQEDGSLVYVARRDNQVKVRGYRIELGEIEQACLAFAGVARACVLTDTDTSGQPSIVAYLVPRPDFVLSDLKAFLTQKLPTYMQPAQFVLLDRLPVTPNGKIDTKALPRPANVPPTPADGATQFSTDDEQGVGQLFQEAIPGPPLPVDANLFEHGLNSLRVIDVARRLHRVYPNAIQIQDIFSYPTIRQLAGLVGNRTAPKVAPNEPIHRYEL